MEKSSSGNDYSSKTEKEKQCLFSYWYKCTYNASTEKHYQLREYIGKLVSIWEKPISRSVSIWEKPTCMLLCMAANQLAVGFYRFPSSLSLSKEQEFRESERDVGWTGIILFLRNDNK